jgi:hypothetical protein
MAHMSFLERTSRLRRGVARAEYVDQVIPDQLIVLLSKDRHEKKTKIGAQPTAQARLRVSFLSPILLFRPPDSLPRSVARVAFSHPEPAACVVPEGAGGWRQPNPQLGAPIRGQQCCRSSSTTSSPSQRSKQPLLIPPRRFQYMCMPLFQEWVVRALGIGDFRGFGTCDRRIGDGCGVVSGLR